MIRECHVMYVAVATEAPKTIFAVLLHGRADVDAVWIHFLSGRRVKQENISNRTK